MKRDNESWSSRPTGWLGPLFHLTCVSLLVGGALAASVIVAPASAAPPTTPPGAATPRSTPVMAATQPSTPNLPAAVNFLTTTTTANGVAGGTTLSGNGYYESAANSADWDLTINGAFALAATGTDNATLAKVVDFIAHGSDGSGKTVADWTGTSPASEVSGAFPNAYSGAIGEEALLAEVVGDDPRAIGGQNLIAWLDQEVCTSVSTGPPVCAAPGSYENVFSTFGQALAIMAQLRAGDDANAVAPIRYLESQQETSGAWPSLVPSTGDSDPDSTAMAVMALAIAPGQAAADAVTKGIAWLAANQGSDGGWVGASGDSTNSAALALMALDLDRSSYAAQIAKGIAFLATQQNPDGGFNVAVGQPGSDVRASAQVVSGIVGTSFGTLLDPLNPPPTTTTTTNTTPTTTPPTGTTPVGTTPAGTTPAVTAAKPATPTHVHISGLRTSRRAWAEAAAGRHPISTTFSFELNLAARLTLTFARVQRGRAAGHRCVAPSTRNASDRGCTHTIVAGSLQLTGHPGLNRVRFTGRMVNGRWLPAGRYQLVITARGAAGHSSTSPPLQFTIARGA
jgi:hypothetical protein